MPVAVRTLRLMEMSALRLAAEAVFLCDEEYTVCMKSESCKLFFPFPAVGMSLSECLSRRTASRLRAMNSGCIPGKLKIEDCTTDALFCVGEYDLCRYIAVICEISYVKAITKDKKTEQTYTPEILNCIMQTVEELMHLEISDCQAEHIFKSQQRYIAIKNPRKSGIKYSALLNRFSGCDKQCFVLPAFEALNEHFNKVCTLMGFSAQIKADLPQELSVHCAAGVFLTVILTFCAVLLRMSYDNCLTVSCRKKGKKSGKLQICFTAKSDRLYRKVKDPVTFITFSPVDFKLNAAMLFGTLDGLGWTKNVRRCGKSRDFIELSFITDYELSGGQSCLEKTNGYAAYMAMLLDSIVEDTGLFELPYEYDIERKDYNGT